MKEPPPPQGCGHGTKPDRLGGYARRRIRLFKEDLRLGHVLAVDDEAAEAYETLCHAYDQSGYTDASTALGYVAGFSHCRVADHLDADAPSPSPAAPLQPTPHPAPSAPPPLTRHLTR